MKEVVLQGNDGKIIGKFTVTDETFEKRIYRTVGQHTLL